MIKTEDAARLLNWERPIILVTNSDDGPDARAISAVKHDGIKTVWMVTGKSSDKFRELSKDPHCLIYATDSDDTGDYLELRLRGTIELLDDAESRATVWRDEYACYFPAGKDDPNLCVLKFTTDSVTMQTIAEKKSFAIE